MAIYNSRGKSSFRKRVSKVKTRRKYSAGKTKTKITRNKKGFKKSYKKPLGLSFMN